MLEKQSQTIGKTITDNQKNNHMQLFKKQKNIEIDKNILSDSKIKIDNLWFDNKKIVCDTVKYSLWYNIYIFRPLLNIPKNQIEFLCDKFNIPYFVDKTNIDETVSKRNKIRKIIFELASLANVTKDWKNMFFESWKNIYGILEEKNHNHRQFKNNHRQYDWKFDIELKDVYQDMWDKLEVSFLKEVKFNKNLDDLNIDDVVEVLNKLWVYKDITRSNLEELLRFFKYSQSGWKQFKWVYFIKTVWRIFVADKLPNEGFTWKILQQKDWYIIRYPKRGDKIGWKPLTKYLNKLKVPSFLRGWVKVKETDNGVEIVEVEF